MDNCASWNKVWRPVVPGSCAALGPFHQNTGPAGGLATPGRDGLVRSAVHLQESELLRVQAGKASDSEVCACCSWLSTVHPAPSILACAPSGGSWGCVPQRSLLTCELQGRQAGSGPPEWILVGPEQARSSAPWAPGGQVSRGRKPFIAVLSQKRSWRSSLFSLDPCCCRQPPCGPEGRQPGRGQTWAEGKKAFLALHRAAGQALPKAVLPLDSQCAGLVLLGNGLSWRLRELLPPPCSSCWKHFPAVSRMQL